MDIWCGGVVRICRVIMVMLFSGLHQGIMTRTIGVSDSVLIQIDNLGVPRVGILNTFAGEYSDSVRLITIIRHQFQLLR